MAENLRTVLGDLATYQYNPLAVKSRILDGLKSGATDADNVEILDPADPVIFSLEATVALACMAIEHDVTCLRKAYPAMAESYEDLYNHMSDVDYLDRFALPSGVPFNFIIGMDELKNKAIPLISKDTRRLVIPRDTKITIGGYAFTLQYAIELRVLPYGGVQVIYNTDTPSPISALSSNTLQWTVRTVPHDGLPLDFLQIEVPMLQYDIQSGSSAIVLGTSYRNTYTFPDKFFYARVWMRRGNKWVELLTTHSQEVIDPTRVTAQLRVTEGQLEVYIPDIYVRSGLASGEIRTDIYYTKGKIDLDLRAYTNPEEYEIKFRDLNGETPSEFSSPLEVLTYKQVFCNNAVTGGRNELSFGELRRRVIDNALGGRLLPISDEQLRSVLNDMGYDVTKSIDFVTDRIYHASSELLPSTIPELSTSIGTINGILQTSYGELATLPTVYDNGNRVTLSPKTLYEERDGRVYLDTAGNVDSYKLLSPGERARLVNSRRFLFTPFHYVLDNNSNVFEARPYYLSNPKVENKRFVHTNTKLNLDVGVGDYAIDKVVGGYRLLILTRSGETYKSLPDGQCEAQICFTPRGYSDDYARLNGKLISRNDDKERLYEFFIACNMDIDRNHDMIVTNFTMFGDKPTPIPLQLDADLEIIFLVNGYTTPEYRSSTIDKVAAGQTRTSKGVTQERLRLALGKYLPTLWANARPIAGNADYMRYEEDVVGVYSRNVYAVDPTTNMPILEMVGGKPKLKIAHYKGDPILNPDGTPWIEFEAGSVIYGDDKEPIIKNPRGVLRRVELFLLDGRYVIADAVELEPYINKVTESLMTSILTDIPSIDGQLRDKTELYLYPKNTFGLVRVRMADSTVAKIDSEIAFKVRFYVSNEVRRNTNLLTNISNITREVVVANLQRTTLSASSILADLRARIGEDIIDVEMAGWGENEDQYIYSVLDPSDKLTLKKKARVNPDNTISIVDDIITTFTKHDK